MTFLHHELSKGYQAIGARVREILPSQVPGVLVWRSAGLTATQRASLGAALTGDWTRERVCRLLKGTCVVFHMRCLHALENWTRRTHVSQSLDGRNDQADVEQEWVTTIPERADTLSTTLRPPARPRKRHSRWEGGVWQRLNRTHLTWQATQSCFSS